MRWLGPDAAVWKVRLLWVTAGGGLFLLFFGATFPYSGLQARLITEIQRTTGLDVRVADWSVGFPLALEWRQVTVSRQDWLPIQIGMVRAQVGVLKLLAGGMKVDVLAQVDEVSSGQGTFSSTMTASSWSQNGPVSVIGQLRQVDLSKLVRPYVSRGTVTGEFAHRVTDRTDASSGEGTWKAEARDVLLEQIPLGNGRTMALTFSTISLGMTCRRSVCDVTELKGDGIDGTVTGQGSVTLRQPLQQSQLALSLTVIPGVGFASKAAGLGIPPLPPGTPFTFKLTGPLAQARVAL